MRLQPPYSSEDYRLFLSWDSLEKSTPIGPIEISVSPNDYRKSLAKISLLFPHWERRGLESSEGRIHLTYHRNRKRGLSPKLLDYLQTPKDETAVFFYSDRAFLPQFLGALGSFILHNPSHRVFFLDGIMDASLNSKLEVLGVTILRLDEAESLANFDLTETFGSDNSCLSVARKTLCNVLAASGRLGVDQVLVSDIDVIFRTDIRGAFDEMPRESILGVCPDSLPTRCRPVLPYESTKLPATSLGGFLDDYVPWDIYFWNQLVDRLDLIQSAVGYATPPMDELYDIPYFNAGLLFMRPTSRLSFTMEALLDSLRRGKDLFRSLPWREQTLLNFLCVAHMLPITWLNSNIWNFTGEGRKILHLTGSGTELRRYSNYREEVEEAWSLFGRSFLPGDPEGE